MSKVIDERAERQERVAAWVTRNWGRRGMRPRERAERLFEETCELMQAEGIEIKRLGEMASQVYAKSAGTPAQEVGGISVCLLAYCESRVISADHCELAELHRIESKSVEHFRARHQAKVESGLAMPLDEEGEAP